MPAATAATNQRRARGRSTSSRNVYSSSSNSSFEETTSAITTTHAYTPLEHLDSESDGLMFDDDAVTHATLKFGHPTIEGVTAADSARTADKSRDLKFPICTCAPLQSTSAAVISPAASSSNSSSPSTSPSSGSASTSTRSFLFPITKAIAQSRVSLATTTNTTTTLTTTAATSFAGSESDYNAYVDLLQSQTRNITKRRRSSQQQGSLPTSASVPLYASSNAPAPLSQESSPLSVGQAVVSRRTRRHPQQYRLRALEQQDQQNEVHVDLDVSSSNEESASTSDQDESRRGRSASPKPLASFTAPIQPLSPFYQDLPEAASVPDSEASSSSSSDVHQFDLDDYFAFKPKVLTAKLEALLAEAPHFAAAAAATAEPYSYGGSDDGTDEDTDVESTDNDVVDVAERSFPRSFIATSAGQRLCQAPSASLSQPVETATVIQGDDDYSTDDDEATSDPESDCSIASFVLPDLEFDDHNSRNLTLHRTTSYGVRTPPAALTLHAAALAAPQGSESIDDRLDKALAFARWNKENTSRVSPSSVGLHGASDTLRQLLVDLRA